MKAFKLLFIVMLLSSSIYTLAGDTRRTITLGAPTKKGTVSKPHAPARIPLLCELEGDQIVITADDPVMLIAEVSANDNTEVVADYFSEEPKTIHQFTIEPQNTALTIEIQVGDKTYIGEFFY